MNPDRLTRCLRKGGKLELGRVRTLTMEELHQGMTAQVVRLVVEYDPPQTEAPASLIAKFPSAQPAVRELAGRFRLYERESAFYRDLAPRAGVATPRCYFSGEAGEDDPFLILEDLAPAQEGDLAAGCNAGQAERILAHLARMHAAWWESPELSGVDWLPTAEQSVGTRPEEQDLPGAWSTFRARFGNHLPPDVIRLGESLHNNNPVLHRLSQPPYTLVHGDCRINNMLFSPGGELAAVIDWQVAIRGRPACDVACLLASSLTTEHRLQEMERLVELYHRLLCGHGVTGYSLEECRLDFRLEVLSEFIQTVVWASMDLGKAPGREGVDAAGAAAAGRLFATAQDLNLFDLLPGSPITGSASGQSTKVSGMKLNVAGFEVGVTTDPERAARLQESLLYRRVLKPGLDLATRRRIAREMPSAPPAAPFENPEPSGLDPDGAAIWNQVSKLGWYHTIDLGQGVSTPGFLDNRPTTHLFGLPDDMTGMRALDIGTYDGFWAFEMERRGATDVIGIDLDSPLDHDLPRLAKKRLLEESGSEETVQGKVNAQLAQVGMQLPGDGFRLAKQILGSKADRRVLDVYRVSPETLGTFDVVMISQLLLRLRDPQTVIENMFSVTRRFAIVAEPYDPELEAFPRPVSEFVGTEKVGAWWGHSIKSMKKMMEVAGFDPVEEVARFPVTNKVGSFSKVILRGHVPQKQ